MKLEMRLEQKQVREISGSLATTQKQKSQLQCCIDLNQSLALRGERVRVIPHVLSEFARGDYDLPDWDGNYRRSMVRY